MPQIAFLEHTTSSWKEVIIHDPKRVEKKLRTIHLSDLAIITDFDRTLTKHFIDGAERPSLIGSLRATGVLSPEYTFAAYCLYDFFYPIEIDVSLSHEERAEAMEQWWNAHLSLLTGMMSYETLRSIVGDDTIMKRLYDTKYNVSDAEKQFWEKHRESQEKIPVQLTQKIIEDAIHSGIVELRNGTDRFFQETLSFHIPIIIFSANGLGTDPITSYLTSHHLMFSNIHIVSNAFTWSPDGRANGYRQPVIHSFNKSIAGIQKFPDIYAYVKDAGSIVLLGDSLGDARMAEGHDADTILRIGLLTKQGENLEQEKRAYSEAFDIVLVGDGDLTFLPSLLHTFKD